MADLPDTAQPPVYTKLHARGIVVIEARVPAKARESRTGYPIPLAVGICCYALAVIAGMFLLEDNSGSGLQVPLWITHGVILSVLILKLGVAGDSSAGTALFIVVTSLFAAYSLGLADEDFTLQQRGEKVTATVVEERRDPARGRKGRNSHYTLERRDGTRIPGPEMRTTSDAYDVGQVLTVLADPEGKLKPRTLGEADATGELVLAGALALAALGSVGWMTWKGPTTAKRREDEKLSARMREEQEEKLREALRTFPADRRDYIKVHPEEYPDVSQHRAARIAWEMGLRAEAAGNRDLWRFRETVNEEVPHD
jgi:hypothetical protein